MSLATAYDLPFSRDHANPESGWGRFLATYGELPAYVLETAAGVTRVISDCHFAVQLNYFIPGFLSYLVAAFLK
jgi:hypothetical protein